MLLLRRDGVNVRRVEGVGMEQRAWLRGCPRVSNERRIILNGLGGEEEESVWKSERSRGKFSNPEHFSADWWESVTVYSTNWAANK